ncbi:hypothetical protein QR680_008729 [Steinernema hermaphroditum]|uniref:ABC transporter domain-containing protein n=1 Tax=Steinernema hermaphroditum TaxID=289476 RepID=A0AA39IK07_9BILA|nr:hypothetical protein QR680_008729 [Steinernema hermaphroditum]
MWKRNLRKRRLIAALLGEMTKESGSVHSAKLKSKVFFRKPLDEKYYEEVIEACALKPDLEMLAAGDMTEIGERGINLSGGQKQRVSLARAVYSQIDVFLLDDTLRRRRARREAPLRESHLLGDRPSEGENMYPRQALRACHRPQRHVATVTLPL